MNKPPPFLTWIEDTPDPNENNHDPQDVNELPIKVRKSIVWLHTHHKKTVEEIALIWQLPEEWVRLFVETPPGSTEH